MLRLEELKKNYDISLHSYERFIIREYLQYKILEIIFDSAFSEKVVFLGGTCLRIVHDNNRFSEDLDFDNFDLSSSDFESITDHVKSEIEKLGFAVEIRVIEKGAYHCYIRFPEILFNEGLSNHKEEKILISLDSESHEFEYTPDKPILNKFDVFTQINATPLDILLSQKYYAIINRKRNKGRDFYDIVFLHGLNTVPNLEYLKFKLGISNLNELKEIVIAKCDELNMEDMAEDVSPFLFDRKDAKKVILFADYVNQIL